MEQHNKKYYTISLLCSWDVGVVERHLVMVLTTKNVEPVRCCNVWTIATRLENLWPKLERLKVEGYGFESNLENLLPVPAHGQQFTKAFHDFVGKIGRTKCEKQKAFLKRNL